MRDVAKGEYAPEQIQRMVQGIPFFNEVIRTDPLQIDQIMTRARLLHAEPGEAVIRKGDTDPNLYFLLKGQLNVMGGAGDVTVLNTISPGQPFGTLAMIRSMPRSATLLADPKGKAVVLLALDYNFFRDIDDYSLFTLPTKLSFYKMVVNDIRWTLEMAKKADATGQLAQNMRRVPLFTGQRGTREELGSLRDQALALADILIDWNANGRR